VNKFIQCKNKFSHVKKFCCDLSQIYFRYFVLFSVGNVLQNLLKINIKNSIFIQHLQFKIQHSPPRHPATNYKFLILKLFRSPAATPPASRRGMFAPGIGADSPQGRRPNGQQERQSDRRK
jgi:hypothetical protein